MAEIKFNEEDLPYEEEILRNPDSIKHWLRYIEFKKGSSSEIINIIYERALREFPGSYKLWYNYLTLRRKQVYGKCITDPVYEDVNNAFERSLVFMHKMPRMWLDYCQFLVQQKKITRTRHAFDRALRALPVTQHQRIWTCYLQFVKQFAIPETAICVYRRYLKLHPENAEEYIDYLKSIGRVNEAAIQLASIVNKNDFVSKEGKSNHQLWNELCDLISKNPDRVKSLKVVAIFRGGLERYTEQVGQLWNSFADYYIRSGLFERARDIYEEAIQTVKTVRDFRQVFNAYAQSEESTINAKMEATTGQEEEIIDIDFRLARFEALIGRWPLLLNSVSLRQNPHNVHQWHKRVKLFDGNHDEIANVYTEAVQTVDPKLAIGKLNSLWISFAKFYDHKGRIEDARIIFEKAVQVTYTQVDDLATVWCEWANIESNRENHEKALELMHRATMPPSRKVAYDDETETVQMRLYKSLKVWSKYADLEEAFGTFTSCKAVYDRILDLRISTPQIIINFGLFLEENNYFEDAFKAYEKGIALFKWPNVYSIWNTYLTKFLNRYGGKKLERARDLLEQCLADCPANFAKSFYLLYAKLEEEHGLATRVMTVYDRATTAVEQEDMFEMFNIYIKKASEIYGETYTRSIYEKAITGTLLPNEQAEAICLKFADLKRKLGQVDRARAIYVHCSKICDSRTTNEFWQTWNDFEIHHGNEDTKREMLRLKQG